MRVFDSYSETHEVFIKNYNQTMQLSGIAYIPNFYLYNNYFKKHIIENYEEYRPDKIAYNLWGNQLLSWVLNEINHFTHGIQEYTKGREINYLDTEILRDIGII